MFCAVVRPIMSYCAKVLSEIIALSTRVRFSDSGPTLYLVQGRANPVLHGPNSTESIVEKPHTGLDECPRILLSGFRARNSRWLWPQRKQ